MKAFQWNLETYPTKATPNGTPQRKSHETQPACQSRNKRCLFDNGNDWFVWYLNTLCTGEKKHSCDWYPNVNNFTSNPLPSGFVAACGKCEAVRYRRIDEMYVRDCHLSETNIWQSQRWLITDRLILLPAVYWRRITSIDLRFSNISDSIMKATIKFFILFLFRKSVFEFLKA